MVFFAVMILSLCLTSV